MTSTGAASMSAPRRILHVGCGGARLPEWVPGVETRLDISPDNAPDIVASMCEMPMVADGSFDGVYCSHALEHLYPHDVGKALREFRRVLGVGGTAIIIVPDLEDARPTEDVLYESPAGPVRGLDLFYGFRPAIPTMPHMAHHTGFIAATLRAALEAAGFINIWTRRCPDWNLLGIAERT